MGLRKNHSPWQVARFVGKHWPHIWVCTVTPSGFRATWPSRQQGSRWTPGLTAEHWVWIPSGWASLIYSLGGDVTRAAPLFLAGCHGRPRVTMLQWTLYRSQQYSSNFSATVFKMRFPDGSAGKESACKRRRHRRHGFSGFNPLDQDQEMATHSSILA